MWNATLLVLLEPSILLEGGVDASFFKVDGESGEVLLRW